ncbi:MAG: 4-phosphopantoate--beta-alanine ligase [Candidatus Methanolliviera sp. GoM_asphalt]|nr:MAG: 4-phosphopantoate--beta-alanine ligase [Candidatus Methanolliviera sp. GoM_asphalt]
MNTKMNMWECTKEKIIEGVKLGITGVNGLMAEGRGEAFGLLMGEDISPPTMKGIKAAVASLILSEHPVISVNGNTAAIVPKDLVLLSKEINAPLEVNLFYRTEERVERIVEHLKKNGALVVLGERKKSIRLKEIDHARGIVDERGIYRADTVLLALEDGDRTKKLKDMGKTTIAIELNPFSRTARDASITIIGNVVNVIPEMMRCARVMKRVEEKELKRLVEEFKNEETLLDQMRTMAKNMRDLITFNLNLGKEFLS